LGIVVASKGKFSRGKNKIGARRRNKKSRREVARSEYDSGFLRALASGVKAV
jgi:hypothetical protein